MSRLLFELNRGVPNGTLRGVRGRRKSSLLDYMFILYKLILYKLTNKNLKYTYMNLISIYIYISKRRKYLKIWYNHISEVFFMSDRHRKNNFSIDDLVKRLGDTIDTKINESNFSDLNETVKRSIDIALDQVNNSVIGQNLFGRNSYKKSYNKSYDPSNTIQTNKLDVYARRPENYAVNLVFQIIFGATSLLMLILGIIFLVLEMNFIPFFAIFGLMFGISYFFSRKRKEIARYKSYIGSLDQNGYAEVSSMAYRVGIAESSVVKDLHRLIDKRFFYQGHLVENDTIFLVNDELYSYYQSGQESRRQRDIEKEKLESNKELKEFQDTCQEAKQELVSLEGSLIDPDMKQRCSDISYLIESLETIVAKNPGKLHRLDRFSSYYMPITIKLLRSYQDLENKPSTDLLNKSMIEIGTTMDTIIEAYQRLVDQLIQVDNIDIKSDISVLKTMLAQDGLSGTSPFENKNE